MSKYYAGIGSRETPKDILIWFEQLGAYLSRKDFVLRSGGAKGADKSFENGCDRAKGPKEIYLPWKNFEGSSSDMVVNNPNAFTIAEKFHPYWHNLSGGAKSLQARNSHQVLGLDLETHSRFVICWTRNGKGSGGTGQAIRIAKAYNVPVFDAGKYADIDKVKAEIKSFFIEKLILKEDDFQKKI